MFVIVIFPLQVKLDPQDTDIIIHVPPSHLHVREQWDQGCGWVGIIISVPRPSAADGTDYITTAFPPVFWAMFSLLIS